MNAKSRTASKRGRPTGYTQEIADEICARISCGDSLLQISADFGGEDEKDQRSFYRKVLNWLDAHEEFLRKYARARELSADADADKVGDIARRVLAGEIDPKAADTAINAMKWSSGKRQPKKYGERIEVNSNSDPLNELLAEFRAQHQKTDAAS